MLLSRHSFKYRNCWTKKVKTGRLQFVKVIFSLLYRSKAGEFRMAKKKPNIEVQVNGPVERALRQLKKKIEREGVVRDMKRTVYFEPRTQKRRKRLVRAIKQDIMRQITQGAR
jgi:small subunit ribosomal protein S21